MSAAESHFITVQGRKLEIKNIPGTRTGAPASPTIVMLHEGLGSISLWRDFPEQVAAATGASVLAYSRHGYGRSDVLDAPRLVEYMHREALDVLPELLAKCSISRPVLVGHSDGASIALLHAGAHADVRGVVAMAPHVFVEDVSVKSIAGAKTAFETTDLPQKLARHHADSAKTFYGWNDIWLHPDFRAWNIEECLPAIRCPVMVIQGIDDEYGTMAQLDAIAAQTAGPVELVKLGLCRHSPHRDQPEATLAAIARFVASLR
jgi:pimeloyl-ACP methyl ester carboxylesterase